jgi:hypothetical protein
MIAYYFLIGLILSFLIDRVLRYTKVEEPFTTKEIFISIVMWPVMLLYMLYFLVFGDWRD